MQFGFLFSIESSASGWTVGATDSSCCRSGFLRFDAKKYGFFANFGFAPLIIELVWFVFEESEKRGEGNLIDFSTIVVQISEIHLRSR